MKTCLIVDDSKVIRKVARHILETLEFQVDEAGDGREALSRCDGHRLGASVARDGGDRSGAFAPGGCRRSDFGIGSACSLMPWLPLVSTDRSIARGKLEE